MEFTLEPTHQPEATSEQVPVPKATPTEQSSVERKRANKTAQCPHCNKIMSKKTLRYSHYCQKVKEPADDDEPSAPVATPPANPKPQVIREVVKEEVTDDHIRDYIVRKETERREMLAQQRVQRFNTLMSRAF